MWERLIFYFSITFLLDISHSNLGITWISQVFLVFCDFAIHSNISGHNILVSFITMIQSEHFVCMLLQKGGMHDLNVTLGFVICCSTILEFCSKLPFIFYFKLCLFLNLITLEFWSTYFLFKSLFRDLRYLKSGWVGIDHFADA